MHTTTATADIKEVGEADFEREVIERSREVPVVVDFWAAWCGPCRALGPVLEREVAALGGRVQLAKVDTDANPELSARYRIRGIPAVMAFRDGEVVDEFVGAQPASMVREFLSRLSPSEEEQLLSQARRARALGDAPLAERTLGDLLARGDADPQLASQAALLYARVLIEGGRPDEAEAALAKVDGRGPQADEADALRQLLAFLAEAKAAGGEAGARAALSRDGANLDAKFALAAALATEGRMAEALEELLDIVVRSRKFRDDGARRAMLTLFAYLGDSDLVREYRRRLQVVT